MLRKKNIFVLMGGKSPEHEISILSGIEVVKNLDEKKYNIFPVVIEKDGKRWVLTSKKVLLELRNVIQFKGTSKDIFLTTKKDIGGINGMSGRNVNVVFIAMHGPFGEDGTIQGMLELTGLPYTGCGVLASSLGMDKLMFRKILKSENIKHPKYVVVRKGESIPKLNADLGNPPYFVKPHNQGSSVGISKVNKVLDLKKAIKLAYKYSNIVLIDECIDGLEVTCAVLGNDKPIALPLVEIHPLKAEYFDYDSKYTESGAEEIVPARISKALTNKIQNTAIDVYKALGCRGFSRVDFILKDNKQPCVLEINTIPGLTPTSLLPKAAKAFGLKYSDLLDKIIKYAEEKN